MTGSSKKLVKVPVQNSEKNNQEFFDNEVFYYFKLILNRLKGKVYYYNKRTLESSWTKPHALLEAEKATKFLEEQKQKKKPVGKVPVPGTPWCIVWTGDGKNFFFNPSARLSLWEIPEDLKGRKDVLKILEDGPEAGNKKESNGNSGGAVKESPIDALIRETTPVVPTPAQKVAPEEPPAKKVKQEVDPDVLRKTREAKAEKLREEMTLEKRTEQFNQFRF